MEINVVQNKNLFNEYVNYFMEIPHDIFYLLLLWGRAVGSLVKALFCFIKAVLIEPYAL